MLPSCRSAAPAPRRKHHHCWCQTLPLSGSVCGYAKICTITLHWFWCSCVGRQKHFHCWCQTLPLRRSIVPARLQCNMKCVVYIRKELCTMSCCQLARPRFMGFLPSLPMFLRELNAGVASFVEVLACRNSSMRVPRNRQITLVSNLKDLLLVTPSVLGGSIVPAKGPLANCFSTL